MAQTPEASDYTSIQARIKNKDCKLLGFGKEGIPYYLSDYIALVHFTGRIINPNKRGFIDDDLPDILKQLEIYPDTWVVEMNQFKTSDITAVGTVSQLKAFCKSVKKKWVRGFVPTLALE